MTKDYNSQLYKNTYTTVLFERNDMFSRGFGIKKACLSMGEAGFGNMSLQYYLPADKDTVGKRAMRVPDTVPLFDLE